MSLRIVTNVHPIAPAKKTPKSAKSTPKKRPASAKKTGEEGEDDAEESPTKKTKKTPTKKRVPAGPDVVKSIEKEESAGEEE
jgi:hypothetical protein